MSETDHTGMERAVTDVTIASTLAALHERAAHIAAPVAVAAD